MNIDNIRNKFKKEGYVVLRYDRQQVHSYPYDSPWIDDEYFSSIFELIKNNTLVDRTRCYSLYQLMQQANKIDGEILEVGTWRGGTAGILASVASNNKTTFVADTFFGVVKSSEWEHYKDKAHSDTTRETVEALLNSIGKKYTILEGIFPDKTGHEIVNTNFALVHIDVDVYESAKDILNYVWPKLSKGGIVVFDDYGFVSACSGVNKLLDEVKLDDDKIFVHNINGHGYLIKR